jgi:hypothetical protein
MPRAFAFWMVAATLMLGTAACGDNTGPVGGEVTLDLATQHADLGAIVFRVRSSNGTTLTGVQPARASYTVHVRMVNDTLAHGVLFGDLAPGPLVRVGVSDTRRPGDVTATVTEMAARDFAPRTPGGTSLDPVR